MGPSSESLTATPRGDSWALPIAATILVAGSLAFWAVLGMFWLATRPSESRPIVIYYVEPLANQQPRPIPAPLPGTADISIRDLTHATAN